MPKRLESVFDAPHYISQIDEPLFIRNPQPLAISERAVLIDVLFRNSPSVALVYRKNKSESLTEDLLLIKRMRVKPSLTPYIQFQVRILHSNGEHEGLLFIQPPASIRLERVRGRIYFQSHGFYMLEDALRRVPADMQIDCDMVNDKTVLYAENTADYETMLRRQSTALRSTYTVTS